MLHNTSLKNEIKEKPMLFNGEMVRAIQSGRKTQTRRIVESPMRAYGMKWETQNDDNFNIMFQRGHVVAPYQVGQNLWVRETHKVKGLCSGCYEYACDCGHFEVTYEADGKVREFGEWDSDKDFPKTENWRPSIFMNRQLSRINLLVKSVRVERLQDISESDAKSEGLKSACKDGKLIKYGFEDLEWYYWDKDPRQAFRSLWCTVSKEDVSGWNANPWVWVIEFEVVK